MDFLLENNIMLTRDGKGIECKESLAAMMRQAAAQ